MNSATELSVEDKKRHAYRAPDDDFFCLRYQVWYGSFDCAVRTHYRTAPGCLNCEQGRFNLRRHQTAVGLARAPHLLADE